MRQQLDTTTAPEMAISAPLRQPQPAHLVRVLRLAGGCLEDAKLHTSLHAPGRNILQPCEQPRVFQLQLQAICGAAGGGSSSSHADSM
eukprot:scaffold63509_cov63-Phaeocystis_antarctica.AAC.1